MEVPEFIARWSDTGAAERSNAQLFLAELCDVLGVGRPQGAFGDPGRDTYVYECAVTLQRPGGKRTLGRMDLYKAGAFILEAKQGVRADARPTNGARRDTPAWNIAMKDAFGQALGYAASLDAPPPFLIVADIGYCFDLYASFDGTINYRPFPNAQAHRLFLKDLAQHRDRLRAVWEKPLALDPSLHAAKVTRQVAGHLADLARRLEGSGHAPETVARFLMRCIFTMFAEDIGLLPPRLFRNALKDEWIPRPETFQDGVTALWRQMDIGGPFGLSTRLRKFNGGLFRNVKALPLTKEQLQAMLAAADCAWEDVEPAIFGTLLERALDPKERHRLGAHFTPRAYVERLVRPTLEEPLRDEWNEVRLEVRQLVGADFGSGSPRVKGKAGRRVQDARKRVREFHKRLCSVRVLDPACGTGNFLYVAMETMKRLEGEVVAMMGQLGEQGDALHLEGATVTPAQFLGLEKKRWAKEIAELVLWIGFLQWHARTRRNADGSVRWLEPVLQDLHNIECRDAVLAWDDERPALDAGGVPLSCWDRVTMKKHAVTGEEVPDESARAPVTELVNPRRAPWPKADFVVGNPPFLGTKRMRAALGDGYVDALRATYADAVEDNADLVMIWWHRAAELLKAGKVRRFGLITTNSISQAFNRRVVARHLDAGVRIVWAIADHPWTDSESGAAVRIAMTVCSAEAESARLVIVESEQSAGPGHEEADVVLRVDPAARIHADLRAGGDITAAVPLRANGGIASMGVALHGAGFILGPEDAARLRSSGATVIRRYLGGRDLLQSPRERYLIDFSFQTEAQARAANPAAFQRVLDTVYPERRENRRDTIRTLWWRFGWERPVLRRALAGLPRFIATTETSKHRVFQFIDGETLPDHMIVAAALDDGYFLGVLSSRIHVTWALAAGARLGVGNDPRYTKTRCFDPFPFPAATEAQQACIRAAAEALDAHRKARQAEHPTLTLTGMYNVLEKLRAGETLTDKDKAVHEQGLVSVLRQLHDELDAAVFTAYGWPATLGNEEILERVVRLNSARATEERAGVVRWLRPEFQNPSAAARVATATESTEDVDEIIASRMPWPKALREQLVVLREKIRSQNEPFTTGDVAAAFMKAPKDEIEELLGGLESLGFVLSSDPTSGQRLWQASGAV